LHLLSEALRSFGLVDSFGLRDLIENERLPTKRKLTEYLKSGTKSLPPSISPDFIASVLLATLEKADRKSGKKPKILPKFDFKSIKAGHAQASKYHKTVFEALKYIFSRTLKNGMIERNVDAGRKRVDILFENSGKGFFRRLRVQHNIFCPLIFIECKNYTHDPKNPEYDQLVARFHDKRGRFGILVCRTIKDKKIKNSRCGDIVGGGTGYVIVLEDKDILDLVAARNKNDFGGINNIMGRKLTEVLLGAH
jgi:hypothetical protein